MGADDGAEALRGGKEALPEAVNLRVEEFGAGWLPVCYCLLLPGVVVGCWVST